MTRRREPTPEWAGRATHNWRKLKAAQRAKRLPCALCGQPIDYLLKWPDPGSFTVDHTLARVHHRDLAEDPANLTSAHLACNVAKGHRAEPPSLGLRSEDW